MTRIFLLIVILGGVAAAYATEPAASTISSNVTGAEGLATPAASVAAAGGGLALPANQLALWQESPQPAPPIQLDTPPLPAKPQSTGAPVGRLPPVPDALPATDAGQQHAPVVDNASLPYHILNSGHESTITIVKGRSSLLRSATGFLRTAVVDPTICDILQYSPTELGFIGKAVGTTQVTVWFRPSSDQTIDTTPRSFVVHVVPEENTIEPRLKQLETEINRLFPNSKIRLRTFGQRIIVLGQARDAAEAAEILNIIRGEQIDSTGRWTSGPSAGQLAAGTAELGMGTGGGGGGAGAGSYGGLAGVQRGRWNYGHGLGNEVSDVIVNMLKVPGVHQIMLRVKIAELNRTAARDFGANFSANVQFSNGTLLLQSLLNSSNSNFVVGNFNNNQLSFGIHYLEQHGVIRLLSEPTLVTLSGRAANFVAGGEFAVPTVVGVSGASAVTTDFRAFGAIISFTPFLLDKDLIRLDVSPEFSQINTANTVGGIPGLNTRSVTTTVELRAGQTLAIAGLLDESTNANTQFDFPFIGKLIGPRSVTKSETELIVLVTPELVHPMEPEEVPPLPGFDVTEPDNIEFFLRGDIEGNPTRQYRSTIWPMLQQRYRAGGSPMISGPFGHSTDWAGNTGNCGN